jgi:hypothetical protein
VLILLGWVGANMRWRGQGAARRCKMGQPQGLVRYKNIPRRLLGSATGYKGLLECTAQDCDLAAAEAVEEGEPSAHKLGG